MFPDNMCPLSWDSPDTLKHVLECVVLKHYHKTQDISATDIRYADVLHKETSQLCLELLETRNKLISQPKISGPVHAHACKLFKSQSVLLQCDI